MKVFFQKVKQWYNLKNRWWLPLLIGIFYTLCFPPFNHETFPLFFPFPIFGFFILVPFFFFALEKSLKRALLYLYLFGITASFSQFYWIANVVAEGLWHLIIIGLFAASLFIALYFLIAGLLFRVSLKLFPRFYIVLYPALWILLEFIRGYGDLCFPWNYLGYIFVQVLPLCQLSSITGTFGLSYIVVLGNIFIWELILSYFLDRDIKQKWLHVSVYIFILLGISVWGNVRIRNSSGFSGNNERISLIQNNMDQARWGSGSLDTSLQITESMIYKSALEKPDLIILPESALFCYLLRRKPVKNRVIEWADSVKTPMIIGSLHWQIERKKTGRKYDVYNTAFLVDKASDSVTFDSYFKMTLLPFSETMPFKTGLPILNRINLGGADFTAGKSPKIFSIRDAIRAAPFICYEIIMPTQVRRRVNMGANLIVNITNDGWFGLSTAPFQHASMARMRCVENGVSMARCANSGISMFVDQYGRIIGETRLYARTVCTGDVSLKKIRTFYSRFGEWPLYLSLILVIASAIYISAVYLHVRRRRIYSPVAVEKENRVSPSSVLKKNRSPEKEPV